MNSSRLATLLAVVVIFALLAGTWFIGISPRLAEAARAEIERGEVEAQNTVHQATLDHLIELDGQLPELQAELDELRLAIPGDAKSKSVFRWLQAIGTSAGVTYDNIVMESAMAYVAPVPTPAVGEEEEEVVNPELASAQAALAGGGLYVLPIQFEFIGTYSQVKSAIALAQKGQRYMLVYGVEIEEGLPAGDVTVTALVKGQLFVLLDSTGVPVAVEPAS